MARVLTAAERAAIGSSRFAAFGKLEITDPDGTWRDVSIGLNGVDWLNAITLDTNIDVNAMTLSGSLLRQSGALTLAPFRSDSLVNRSAGGSYAPILDLWRKWRASTAIMPAGYAPTGSDWKEVGLGRMDLINVGDDEIQIAGRDEAAVFLDCWIAVERQYGSVGGVAVETCLQQMLDDNLGSGRANVGSSGYTVYTPVSPAVLLNTWTQPVGNLMLALTATAEKAKGFVFRMRYDSANVLRPTLFLPNRNATVEDWSVGPSEYMAITLNQIALVGVRNFAKLAYADATLGKQIVYSPKNSGTISCVAGAATFSVSQAGVIANGARIVVHGLSSSFIVSAFNGTTGCTLSGAPTFGATNWGTSASLTRFDRRDIEFDLSADSQVNNGTNAQAMDDAIQQDMAFPDLEQQFETPGFWFVQLHDYGRFLANGIHYDTDQLAGVTSLQLAFAEAGVRATIGARGKPAGRYTTWLNLARTTVPGGQQPKFAEALTQITNTTATTVEVTVTANPANPAQQVKLVGVTGGASLLSGTAAGTWVTPNGTNNVWVFNRAAINGGVGQAQFRAGNTNSYQDDDKFVTIEEQGRDTVYLAIRARIISQTATTTVVRVAVADPYPQGAASATITYTEMGTAVATSPASSQTVTPAATLTEAAGTFVDFTITRPTSSSLDAARVTFTATAAGRTTDSDAIDIPMSHDGQGSIIPTPMADAPFSYAAGGPGSPNMWVAWTWGAFSILMPDGSTISIGASSGLTAAPSPTLTQVAGGPVGARNLFVRIAYVKNGLACRISAEATIAVTTGNRVKVTSPAAVTGFDGYLVLIGSVTNTEFYQTPLTGIAFGVDYTEAAGGFTNSGVPYNASQLNAIVAIGLDPSPTVYKYYPWWDIANALVAFADTGVVAKSAANANAQNRDGRIALSVGSTNMSAIMPVGAGANSGTGGGGRYL